MTDEKDDTMTDEKDFGATMLYKHPGRQKIHGDFFDTLIVNSADELKAAAKDGWAKTTPDAIELAAEALVPSRKKKAPK